MLRRTTTADGLSAIYSSHVNLGEWQRELSAPVRAYASEVARRQPGFSLIQVVSADMDAESIAQKLPVPEGGLLQSRLAFAQDLKLLCAIYACLFDLEQIGLRLAALDRAMCPRFHVDQVICRLICTYSGRGTEWLPESNVSRSENGCIKMKSTPGLAGQQRELAVQALPVGSVGLLKGEKWPGNEGRGLVHRSPAASAVQPRLIVTLDPIA